ncbi:hypothetical protein ACFPZ0_18785 [Streptomonospora nanhaiensis]|uniref:hypothetical protein n=1 Tax=Streptomonospora nanhaiensis TaxID=1323731 RepID=UPI001C999415|nr:hypothetical protein [Streptomonospora nanhaiensis]MBX9390161.1 hypothetical protein [Streptomonospora nanhaiensis]
MGADREPGAEYERIYSAAARMLWAQPTMRWHGADWPAERRAAWRDLEAELRALPPAPEEPGAPSDPARHLLVRRTADDRPLPLAAAAREWRERLRAGGHVRHPQDLLLDVPELRDTPVFPPGVGLLCASGWVTGPASLLAELDHRLAPGTPACVVGPEARELSSALHAAADRLRAPFGAPAVTPHPADAPWIGGAPAAAEPPAPHRLDRLRRAARRAAEEVPTRERWRAEREVAVDPDVVDAAEALVRVLDGDPAAARDPRPDPVRSLLCRGEPAPFGEEARAWRALLEAEPAPRAPEPGEVFQPPTAERRWKAMSRAVAEVAAEMLDELAARLAPGRAADAVRFDAYPFALTVREFTVLLRRL